jgi:hypothetical protein
MTVVQGWMHALLRMSSQRVSVTNIYRAGSRISPRLMPSRNSQKISRLRRPRCTQRNNSKAVSVGGLFRLNLMCDPAASNHLREECLCECVVSYSGGGEPGDKIHASIAAVRRTCSAFRSRASRSGPSGTSAAFRSAKFAIAMSRSCREPGGRRWFRC